MLRIGNITMQEVRTCLVLLWMTCQWEKQMKGQKIELGLAQCGS